MLACVEKVKRKTLITGNSNKLQSTLKNVIWKLFISNLHTTISGIRVAHILFLKKPAASLIPGTKTTLGRQTTPSSNFFLHSINKLYNIFIMNYFSVFCLVLWSIYLLNWVQGTSNKYKHTLSWGSTSSSCKTKKQTLFSLTYTSFSLFYMRQDRYMCKVNKKWTI